jgi:hypothetical protein
VNRINKENEGLPPNSKRYIKPKTRDELLTEGKAYLDGLKEKSGVGPAKPKSSGTRVRVVSPEGKTGSIPEEQLDSALRQGYKRAQ